MIALFDMDGTLFWGDSQLRFARWILRRYPLRRLYLVSLVPCALLRGLCIMNTAQLKRAFLAYAWCMKKEVLEQECELFCQEELIPALYPEVLERLREHQEKGDTCVLCSASPNWWTEQLGKALKFNLTIATPVEVKESVSFMPHIPPPGNNKRGNKLLRLAEHHITHADVGYTDSEADLPMLSICKQSVLVNPRDSLIQALEEPIVLRPAHPKCHWSFILTCVLGL